MDYGGRSVPGEDLVEPGGVAEVDLVEDRSGTADLLDAVDGDRRGVDQVVDDDDVVARVDELDDGVASDVSGSAGDEDRLTHANSMRGHNPRSPFWGRSATPV